MPHPRTMRMLFRSCLQPQFVATSFIGLRSGVSTIVALLLEPIPSQHQFVSLLEILCNHSDHSNGWRNRSSSWCNHISSSPRQRRRRRRRSCDNADNPQPTTPTYNLQPTTTQPTTYNPQPHRLQQNDAEAFSDAIEALH